jgi:hypothetical protein
MKYIAVVYLKVKRIMLVCSLHSVTRVCVVGYGRIATPTVAYSQKKDAMITGRNKKKSRHSSCYVYEFSLTLTLLWPPGFVLVVTV